MGKLVDSYLNEMVRLGGSDLHLPSCCPPMIRIFGRLKKTEFPAFKPEILEAMVMEILSDDEKKILLEEKNVDFVYQMDDENAPINRFRTNVFYQKNGLNIVFRGIPKKIRTIQELGLPPTIEKLTHYHQGMVLVTGPSGCGKTATLAALINLINQKRSLHVITVEEPIEYMFKNERSLVIQRQVRRDVDKFATALKASLREDPDVIMVGEMRDLETIQLAITAAETGHLVFSTLHTTTAIATVNRIIDAFPQEQQAQIRTMFSESLRGVVCQQLVPRADGRGRVAATEVLLGTGSVANIIRENKVYQLFSVMQTGKKSGMLIMDESLMDLVKKGIIEPQEAKERAIDLKTMEEALKRIPTQVKGTLEDRLLDMVKRGSISPLDAMERAMDLGVMEEKLRTLLGDEEWNKIYVTR